MACLKLTIGCLAGIGVVVVLLVLAAIGLFALGVHRMFDLPARASASAIASAHAPLLAAVRSRLATPAGLSGWSDPPRGLVAVRQLGQGGAAATDPDLLGGSPRAWSSHTMVDGAGVAVIDRNPPLPCLVYRLDHAGRELWVYIADPGPPSTGPE